MTRRLRTIAMCLLATSSALGAELVRDDFEDGDLTAPLAWEVVRPEASVQKSGEGNTALRVSGGGLVLAAPGETPAEYTVQFTGTVSWGAAVRFVFLYQDEDNHYSFGLGAQSRGLYRMWKGEETQLDADPLDKITLPHGSGISGTYKVFVRRGAALEIQIDKDGDGADYDMAFTEADPAAVAAFSSDRFGFASMQDSATGIIDDVAVHPGKLRGTGKAAVYYVDQESGDDERLEQEAMDRQTPWRSIQKAAEVARAGDTVLVAPGIYRETVIPVHRGSIDAPIVFRAAEPGDRPVVSGARLINRGAWDTVEITDFRGRKHGVLSTRIDWVPAMLFQGTRRMMIAQEPDQGDANDPYDLASFRPFSQPPSDRRLVDAESLKHKRRDYWKGARLLHYDSQPNGIAEIGVVGYDPESHTLELEPRRSASLGGEKGGADRYALRDHLGILDQPGEYYIDRSQEPHRLYLIPYKGMDVAAVVGTARDHGFLFSKGREHIVVDGFVVRDCSSSGILLSGRHANRITIRNCDTIANMGSGISGRFVNDITIERCLSRDNHQNGVSFGNCADMKILDCEITANGDNGIWFGGGQPSHWNSERILIRGCRIHHATARRRHPDNYQMHQVRDVTIENCVFVQDGEQNMWCQYSDNLTLRNNVFIGGPLGINSSMHSYLYHNVFWRSSLRYDRHLNNHPQNRDFYKPQKAAIRNNVFVNSSIAWPAGELVDRFKAYTIDHNYYAIESAHSRSSWDWNGRKLTLGADTLIVTEEEVPVETGAIRAKASVTWGHPAKLVFLYRDAGNYYWMGLGNSRGVYRRMNGEETCLFKDGKNELRLPHQGGATAVFDIAFRRGEAGIDITIARTGAGGDSRVTVTDDDLDAVRPVAGGAFGMASPPGNDHWCALSEVSLRIGERQLRETFDDQDLGKGGPGEPTWRVVKGTTSIRPLQGHGVGYGDGSIAVDDTAGLTDVFNALPDEAGDGFDFHPAPGSPLVDAGIDVGVTETMSGRPRPRGAGPEIGPHEVQE